MVKDRLDEMQAAPGFVNFRPCVERMTFREQRSIQEKDILFRSILTKSEKVWAMIDKIQENVKEIEKKHSVYFCTSDSSDCGAQFSSSSDISSDNRVMLHDNTKRKLQNLMDDIKTTADKIRAKLMEMEEDECRDYVYCQDIRSPAYERMRKLQRCTLWYKYFDVMSAYCRNQTDCREKCKGLMQKQLENMGRITTIEELEDMLEQGNFAVFIQEMSIESQQLLSDIEARYADIIMLDKYINDLHDILIESQVPFHQSVDSDSLYKQRCGVKEYIESQVEISYRIDTIEDYVNVPKDYVSGWSLAHAQSIDNIDINQPPTTISLLNLKLVSDNIDSIEDHVNSACDYVDMMSCRTCRHPMYENQNRRWRRRILRITTRLFLFATSIGLVYFYVYRHFK